MGPYASLWVLKNPYGSIMVMVESYTSFCIFIDSYRSSFASLWDLMVLYWFLWVFMGLNGS